MPADDEIFVWGQHIWSITRARDLLAGRSPTGLLSVESAFNTMKELGTYVNEEYADQNADLTRPLFCISIPNVEGVVTIDGHHRLYAAHKRGIATLPYFLLNEEEEKSIKLRSPSRYAAPLRTEPKRSVFSQSKGASHGEDGGDASRPGSRRDRDAVHGPSSGGSH